MPEARIAGDPHSLLLSLLDISRLPLAAEDLRTPARHLLEIAFALTGLEDGCVYLYKREQGVLAPLAWEPSHRPPPPKAVFLDGKTLESSERLEGGMSPWEGALAHAAMTGQSFYEFAKETDAQERHHGAKPYTAIIMPLVARGYVVGALSLRAGGPVYLADRTLGLLNLAGNQIAAVIEGARLYEEAVSERAKARAIVDSCVEGILVVDAARRIVDVNPALLSLTGFSADELLGHTCTYRLNARDKQGRSVCDTYCPLLEGAPEQPGEVEATATTRDGREVWIGITYGKLKDSTGRASGVVHTIRDISAQKATERMKDNFLAAASHELRTPITSIRGYAQMLSRRLGRQEGREEDVKALRVIIRQVDRLIDLVNQLLDVSRIQKGDFDLALGECDLTALVAKVVAEVGAVAARHEVVVDARPPVLVRADVGRIEQVLASLLANAVAYSPSGGRVNVHVRAMGNEAVVAVEDQGIGIPPDQIDRVFERFYRAHVDPPHCFGGIGLGLYVSRDIVARHGGKMWVESKEGVGSTFYFSLPLVR